MCKIFENEETFIFHHTYFLCVVTTFVFNSLYLESNKNINLNIAYEIRLNL